MKRGRITTGVLLWLAAAVAATLVGMTAVAAIGTDIFGGGQDPLSQSEVDDLLSSRASSPAPPPTTSSQAPPVTSAPPVGEQQQTDTEGGTVISRCGAGGLVEVLSAVPAQGYQVESDDDDLDDHPSVKFTSGEREVEVRLRCVNGVPVPEIKTDD